MSDDQTAKDMQLIKDCAYVVYEHLSNHMTADAQRNILYIVRIADKYISANNLQSEPAP